MNKNNCFLKNYISFIKFIIIGILIKRLDNIESLGAESISKCFNKL
jgi:hypothetical protein